MPMSKKAVLEYNRLLNVERLAVKLLEQVASYEKTMVADGHDDNDMEDLRRAAMALEFMTRTGAYDTSCQVCGGEGRVDVPCRCHGRSPQYECGACGNGGYVPARCWECGGTGKHRFASCGSLKVQV